MDVIQTSKISNVSLVERYSSKRNAVGTLFLTATHLMYFDHDNKRETWILHSHISSAGKLPLSTSGSPIQIRTKTFISLTFIIPKERDAHDLFTSLNKLCQPESMDDLYCFRYIMSSQEMSRSYGWSFFDIKNDFDRMNIPPEWTMSTLNEDYDYCDTYPRFLYVPTTATSSILIGSTKFRSRGRLPVMTYIHSNQAALCRCSQPLSGFSARCVEDENLLVCIQKANPNKAQLVVVDTRPRINAMANRAAGKGYEKEANYENTRFMFAGIDNIHVMRSSLAKLVETCELKWTQMMPGFLSGLESSGWLRHIKSVMDAALQVARTLDEGSSVVVHCSDGWDRTAQVCGLAQIILDPYYRTLEGFQTLICKEWLDFGHKFTDRCGHIQVDPKEVSPVFTQWLECVWNMMVQFPFIFEFNERLLLTIHDHLHSCQFGTFIGNCQKDRIDLRLSEKTYSLWGYLATHRSEFLNPMYDVDQNSGPVFPSSSPQTFRFWRGMYCRWENGLHPRESLLDLASTYKDHMDSLTDHIELLKKRIKHLEKINSGEKLTNGKQRHEVNENDNRYNYGCEAEETEKKSEVVTSHPLIEESKPWTEFSKDGESMKTEVVPPTLSMEELTRELESVALDWKSVRSATKCPCSTPLDFSAFKKHCSRCGGIFCSRCLEKLIALPGHESRRKSKVCVVCYKACNPNKSMESPE